jgi:hypothetical protein
MPSAASALTSLAVAPSSFRQGVDPHREGKRGEAHIGIDPDDGGLI